MEPAVGPHGGLVNSSTPSQCEGPTVGSHSGQTFLCVVYMFSPHLWISSHSLKHA